MLYCVYNLTGSEAYAHANAIKITVHTQTLAHAHTHTHTHTHTPHAHTYTLTQNSEQCLKPLVIALCSIPELFRHTIELLTQHVVSFAEVLVKATEGVYESLPILLESNTASICRNVCKGSDSCTTDIDVIFRHQLH